jgi:hypothetical protein
MHCEIIGATRSGKTNYMLSEMEGAFCFIDKHGEAARQLADSLPCIYWRPADLSHPVGLNPLANVPQDLRWKVTADIVSVFSDIWKLGPETPRLIYHLRSALRILPDSPNTTLLDIRRVLSDDMYRTKLLRKCTDQEARQSRIEFSRNSPRDQAIEIASLQNKVAAAGRPAAPTLRSRASQIDHQL